MKLNDIALFKMISRKMDWLTQRQEVLAQNIANADTPKYRPYDLKPLDFAAVLADTRRLEPRQTHATHLTGLRAADHRLRPDKERHTYDTAPDGNAVVLEEQLMKVADTGADYQTMVNLYRKHLGLLRSALGRGGGA